MVKKKRGPVRDPAFGRKLLRLFGFDDGCDGDGGGGKDIPPPMPSKTPTDIHGEIANVKPFDPRRPNRRLFRGAATQATLVDGPITEYLLWTEIEALRMLSETPAKKNPAEGRRVGRTTTPGN